MFFSKGKLLESIDIIRFPLSLLVILAHCGIFYHGPKTFNTSFYDIVVISLSLGVCYITVPAFFFISGYLFFYNQDKWKWSVWMSKIKRRIKTLVIPYFIWNLFAFLAISVLAMCFNDDSRVSIGDIFWKKNGILMFWSTGNGQGPINFPLWFIRDLFIVCLMTPLLWIFLKNRIATICLFLILLVLYFLSPESFSRLSMTSVLFFSFGALFSVRGVENLSISKNQIKFVFSIALIVLILMIISFGTSKYLLFRKVFGIFGLLPIFLLIGKLPHKISKKFKEFSEACLFIYAIHTVLIRDVVFIIVSRLLCPTNDVMAVIGYFISFILVSLLSITAFYMLKKASPTFLYHLTGRRP